MLYLPLLVNLAFLFDVLFASTITTKGPLTTVIDPSDDLQDWHLATEQTPAWNAGHHGLRSNNRMDRKRHHKNRWRAKLERKMKRKERRKNRRLYGILGMTNVRDDDFEDTMDEYSDSSVDVDDNRENYDYKPLASEATSYGPQIFASSDSRAEGRNWLESNITSIWLALRHIRRDIKQLRRQFKGSRLSDDNPSGDAFTEEPCDPTWEIPPNACTDEHGLICGGRGRCSCGQCLCESPYYGISCRCNDMVCQRHGGVLCGGAGRGQCRCGSCVCRPDFTGNACECSLSTSNCHQGDKQICGGKGECVCNRCQCHDGFTGQYCDESIYSASVCERLKPCVLCKAYGKKYPQCSECNIKVQTVEELESSRETCVMVNSGCILKYAYNIPVSKNETTTILVKKDRACP